jgi:hypothetical protein
MYIGRGSELGHARFRTTVFMSHCRGCVFAANSQILENEDSQATLRGVSTLRPFLPRSRPSGFVLVGDPARIHLVV